MSNKITKTSKNTNCLEGVKCPKCGQEDLFKIAANVIVEVSDDGTEDQGSGYEWDQQAFCQCCECDHAGKLSDFTIENWGKEKEPAAPDLLKTLESALRGLRNPAAHPMAQQARIKNVTAAIAKVRGAA